MDAIINNGNIHRQRSCQIKSNHRYQTEVKIPPKFEQHIKSRHRTFHPCTAPVHTDIPVSVRLYLHFSCKAPLNTNRHGH